MRHIGTALHILAATAIIAAIWTPWHWQMAATAVLLLLAGAMAHGSRQIARTSVDQPVSADGYAGDNPASADTLGNSTGPHVHYAASTTSRTYGKQAN